MDWVPQWYDRAETAAEATPITIGQAGDIVRVPLVLEPGGSIAGFVRDAHHPTDDHIIYVTPADTLEVYGYTMAFDGSAPFFLNGLRNGDWKLGACRRSLDTDFSLQPPAATVWYPGVTSWDAAAVLSISGHSAITDIEIQFEAPRR
jgi:hypothetical protein